VHWAESSLPWESYISGDPGQAARSNSIMATTAEKLGGSYIPPAGVMSAGGGVDLARLEQAILRLAGARGGTSMNIGTINTVDPQGVGRALDDVLFRART
jgi:hypothetical protein